MASPEQHTGSAERTAEIQKAAAERSAELREQEPQNGEKLEDGEHHLAEARAEAHEQALPTEKQPTSTEKETSAAHSFSSVAQDTELSYKETMSTIQQDMSAPSRAFSKIIHKKSIEKVSDVAGATIARPNALLSGSVCAFLLVLGLYAHARYVGYALSGFETIAAFIIGWVIGLVFDFLRTMIRGKS